MSKAKHFDVPTDDDDDTQKSDSMRRDGHCCSFYAATGGYGAVVRLCTALPPIYSAAEVVASRSSRELSCFGPRRTWRVPSDARE